MIPHSTMKTNGNIIEWCNSTHQGAPYTGKQTCICALDLGDDQSRYLYAKWCRYVFIEENSLSNYWLAQQDRHYSHVQNAAARLVTGTWKYERRLSAADARWPALAGYCSASAVQACCDSPSLSLTPSSKVSRRLLCASLWSCWSPAPAICQMSSTVSCTSLPQHLWDPCIFCRWTKSLEFTAWSSAGSSCWHPEQFSRDLKTYLFAGQSKH